MTNCVGAGVRCDERMGVTEVDLDELHAGKRRQLSRLGCLLVAYRGADRQPGSGEGADD